MIVKQPLGSSASISMRINGAEFDYNNMNRIEVLLEENKHDMLVVTVNGIPTRAILDYVGLPIQFSLSSSASNSYDFYGYIDDVRPISRTSGGVVNNSPFQKAELYCMGASYTMRGTTSKNWEKYSVTDIAVELAKKYGFSVDAPKFETYHRNVNQSDESDWQFLTRYANSLGLSVSSHGAHIHLYDPYKAVSRSISYAPLLTARKMRGQADYYPGQIIEFDASFSTRHPDGYYKETVITVLNDDGTSYDVSTGDLKNGNKNTAIYRNKKSVTAHSFGEAARILESINKSDYDHYATVLVTGTPGCRPGGVVSVDNYNDSRMDGLWYVQAVKHTAHSAAYMTELKIARNSNSQLVETKTPSFTSPPAPVLKTGQWAALTGRVNVY
jgi:phage protein D